MCLNFQSEDINRPVPKVRYPVLPRMEGQAKLMYLFFQRIESFQIKEKVRYPVLSRSVEGQIN